MCCKNLTCVVILTWSCLKVPAMFLGASLKARPLQEGWPNILHFQSKPGQHLVYRADFLQQETLLTCTSKTKMEFKPENSLCPQCWLDRCRHTWDGRVGLARQRGHGVHRHTNPPHPLPPSVEVQKPVTDFVWIFYMIDIFIFSSIIHICRNEQLP